MATPVLRAPFRLTGAIRELATWLDPTPAMPTPGERNRITPAIAPSDTTSAEPAIREVLVPVVVNVTEPKGGRSKSVPASTPRGPAPGSRNDVGSTVFPGPSRKMTLPLIPATEEGLNRTTSDENPCPSPN